MTHFSKRPSLQPSPWIQSEVEVAATIRITVMKQQVKAITYEWYVFFNTIALYCILTHDIQCQTDWLFEWLWLCDKQAFWWGLNQHQNWQIIRQPLFILTHTLCLCYAVLCIDNRKTKRALIDMIKLYLWAAHYVKRVFVERFFLLFIFTILLGNIHVVKRFYYWRAGILFLEGTWVQKVRR